jgi:Ku protein
VTCRIDLFAASSLAVQTHFHIINKRTGNRVREQMIDEETGDIVDKEQKGRGYEIRKGRYVEITDDEIEAIRLESTHTIDIESFVARSEIDDRYLDRPYYVAPGDRVGAQAFAVIRDAMARKNKVALGRVVLSNREHMIALEPLGKGILGTTLRYDYEVRPEADYFSNIPAARLDRETVRLADHILASKTAEFNPAAFKDRYETALRSLLERKAAGKKVARAKEPERPSNVIDLMDALRGSLSRKRQAPHSASHRGKRQTSRRRNAANS